MRLNADEFVVLDQVSVVRLGRNVNQVPGAAVVGSGIEFADEGKQELSGVPGEWPLFSVAGL